MPQILVFSLIFSLSLSAQTQTSSAKVEKIKVLGSRMLYKTTGDSAVPVDLVTEEDIKQSGVTETGQLLQMVSASFNFSRTTVSDGTDIVRPATLRGMGPDQVLILVNGKRRHSQALVNVQQTIGRGSAGTDINALPITAISSIQILRDGAAAQYGSDAIAGVININLKSSKTSNGEAYYYSGLNYLGDGLVNQLNIGHNINLGQGGIRISGDVRLRGETNRADIDQRYGRKTMRIGDAKSTNYSFFINGDYPIGLTGELYLFGGLTRRDGESAGFFRDPGGDRNLDTLYPNGFLPLLITKTEDQSLTGGYKFDIFSDWQLDNSLSLGRNSFSYASENSINISLGEQSPTSTKNGTLLYQEFNYNLDLKGEIETGLENPINLVFGLAFRQETYEIIAGDFASYAYGPENNLNKTILGQNGERAAPGVQGFPGFQPSDAGQSFRNSQAIYLDAESFLTRDWLLGLAARSENYEKSGSSTIGKITSRYNFSPQLALRGALSSGFRAPSLQQSQFSTHSTTFAQNKLTETQTAPQGSQVYQQLGLPNLKNETSLNSTAGIVWQPQRNTQVSLDYYTIAIKDRIALSGMLQPESQSQCLSDLSNCPIRSALDPLNLGAVQFFTNAIDTQTSGLDLIFSQQFFLGSFGKIKTFASGHLNQTKVSSISPRGQIPSKVIFDDSQLVLTEQGQPRQRYILGLDYKVGSWNTHAQVNYFGSVAGQGFGNYYQRFSGEWITDFSCSFKATKNFLITIGANNIFNVLPDELNADHPVRSFGGGSFRYSWETAPFGYTGGFYYTKLSYTY